jgi:hypothetical protein
LPPQVAAPLQSLRGSVITATGTQAPAAFAQVRHLPAHWLSQQVLSTQLPDPHSPPSVQEAPFGLSPVEQVRSALQ